MRFKHTIFLAAALSLAAGYAHGGDHKTRAGNLEFGDATPLAAHKMKNVDGKELSIADVKGKNGTLVMFSCNSCPWVVAWEDRIAEICNAYQEKGVGVIVINANDPEKSPQDGFEEMKARAKARGFEFPYVADPASKTARAFGATRTPEIFLFNSKDELVYHGAIDDNAHKPDQVEATYLKDALNAVLTGATIETQQTKALGCAIKFRSDS